MTRDSPIVQSNEGLRRNRKALLSDLSSLVKTGKRLQEYTASPDSSRLDSDTVNDTIDEMILKAFKIVTRGVRFLDILDDMEQRLPPVHVISATVIEGNHDPPTPPAETTSFAASKREDPASDVTSRTWSSHSSATARSSSQKVDEHAREEELYKPISSAYLDNPSSRPLSYSRPTAVSAKRQTISQHISLTDPAPAEQRHNLVSGRLNSSHDTFLSYLGSFIGRLHLQSQSSSDLVVTIRQSVTAGRELLMVVEVVRGHDAQSSQCLEPAKETMNERITTLISSARDIMISVDAEEEDVVMPQQNGRLLMAATGCVKAAGECVAKTKFVLERIGDFEFEYESQNPGLGIVMNSDDRAETVANEAGATPGDLGEETVLPMEPITPPPPPPLIIPSCHEALPGMPEGSPPVDEDMTKSSPRTHQPVAVEETVSSACTKSKRSSRRSLLPPLPKLMGSPLMGHDEYSSLESSATTHDKEFQPSCRSTSIAVSSSGTDSTYFSSMRDSESSLISEASTRASTPDLTAHAPQNQAPMSELSRTGSQSTLADDTDESELKMLEKTFAHELLHNKEGQVAGGTLEALVERLTTHDSTPDSMFVSTFYLTFRLFATPIELATALIERFEYVGESPHIAGPVRLRVYNVFKGWLESHWRNLSDEKALSLIESFARDKLGRVLPGAGRRLLELAQKVSSTEGPLVPRQVSSMGKTSTSLAQYIPADLPLPPPNISKSSTSSLKNWKLGGSPPTILDFDPLELARQFTIKEMHIFCSIMPEELLGSEWTKRSGSNAINVRAMSTLSTDLSNLVADTILQHDDARKRAVIIKHWIKIAHKCLELNNYDSLMAIICSLNSSTIIRLKRTWEVVSQKRKDMLKGLQAIVEPDKNYAVLRRRLHDHVSPCLPFVGTYLTDLTFVDAGNPATKQLLHNGDKEGMSVINFDKHTRTAKIIGELQRFQIPYRLTEVPELQEWIQAQIVRVKSSSEHGNVQQFYRKSLLLEPRENLQPRASPVEGQSGLHNATKEKFDIFAWTHSSRSGQALPSI